MNQYEKRSKAIDKLLKEHADGYKAVLDRAEKDNRQPNEDDRAEIAEHMQAIETLKAEKDEVEANVAQIKRVDDLSNQLGPFVEDKSSDARVVNEQPPQAKSLGDQFIESEGYKSLREHGFQGKWSTGQIELGTKGTLTSTPGTALSPPQYQPGVVSQNYQRLYVSDLFAQGVANSPVIRYTVEGAGGTLGSGVVNAATAVAEAGDKPESTLVFSERTDNVAKIATILPVTDEQLEDAPQVQAYINERLSLFVKMEEERQLLDGGGAPEIDGLLGRTGINTLPRGTVDTNADALFKAANGLRGSAFLDPDAILINPANWQSIRLGKDGAQQYYGGGPFYGPYGGPQGPAGASQFSADNLWGMRVLVTSAVGSGTAVVGSFRQGGQIFRRSGLTVEASNSHDTYFAKNLTAIRAEERLALAVYRPGAFCTVTGLS